MSLEAHRKIVHLAFGIGLIVIGSVGGKLLLVSSLVAFFFLGLLIIASWMSGFQPRVIRSFLDAFERKNAKFPGQGALMFVTGALFLTSFSNSLDFTLAVIAILAFGDGFATLAGVVGEHALPFNKSKTWEGVIAFFCAGAVAAGFFVPLQTALFYGALLSVVEASGLPADDNILIPVTAVVFQSLGF